MSGFVVLFLAAYTVNSWAFQLYFDPLILLGIGRCLASLESTRFACGTNRLRPITAHCVKRVCHAGDLRGAHPLRQDAVVHRLIRLANRD